MLRVSLTLTVGVYTGRTENKMEPTIICSGCIGTMQKIESTIVYLGYIGIMEKKMETNKVYWGYILQVESRGDLRLLQVETVWHLFLGSSGRSCSSRNGYRGAGPVIQDKVQRLLPLLSPNLAGPSYFTSLAQN